MLPQGRQLGGAPTNFAYHVSQFGFQGVVVSAIGNDYLGTEILNQLAIHNITSCIATVDKPTGVVNVVLDAKGIPTYEIVENVAWDNIPYNEEIQKLATQARAVCFGTLAQRSNISRSTITQFIESLSPKCLKVFDINLRQHYYNREIIDWSLSHCDILKLNKEELLVLKEMFNASSIDDASFCAKLQQLYNLKIIIVTCGSNGSYVYNDNDVNYEETPSVEVVDTIGAGDSFTAAFVATLLKGKPIIEAHQQAIIISASTCTHKGAI